ncbi:unnamed protein product [Fusarium graminearum]|uniref:Chromosome 3, complete genome n=2 Tax=Gibberella zeae TaxID=5518 RepID=I1RLY9_GIBZE|nr:hypothetical protein FGSG_04960 [Fusarium graminearum PH-1]EYB29211.1 hypothetical protein FG05_04960 [Fusarium graminearum]ESU10856.1 hypothetical protein FGSG_04960 [Fusarium graminearum PH-1]KAI6757900.1 hypothetical protein HG531_003725 [Fusarium graminearum]PCD39829.1 hypothetical protein FGRA07_01100 [Fusarium graminearum]CAF3478397.1 unnamed protein product [Fusarium graminearum]|eukprot:XP_011323432.1 hypothetical protein FGSG_04960 [Fusarium graminearum PH-1]
MCEHRIIWRHCTTCRKRASIPLRHNVNCENVNNWKLGLCATGLREREIEEHVECIGCHNKRVSKEAKERQRLWEKAWPGPDQLGESRVKAEMKNAATQTVEEWPKTAASKQGIRGDETPVPNTRVQIVYNDDDENENRRQMRSTKEYQDGAKNVFNKLCKASII